VTIETTWDQVGTTLRDVTRNNGTYFHLLPSLTYEKRPRTGRKFLTRYFTGVNIPSAVQLLPVINNINPLALYKGNPDLIPEFSHNLSSEISIFDQFSFTTVFLRIGGSYTKDKISIFQTVDSNLVQMNSPVNVPWDYTGSGYMSFSTPLRKLGLKIILTLNESWHKGINIVNSEDNILKTISHSVNLTFESYLKERLNYRIGSSITLTDTKYSIQEDFNNLYFNTVYFGDILYNPNDYWNFQLTSSLTN